MITASLVGIFKRRLDKHVHIYRLSSPGYASCTGRMSRSLSTIINNTSCQFTHVSPLIMPDTCQSHIWSTQNI